MKDDTLKVGSRKSGDKFDVTVKVKIAETDADVAELVKDEAVRVACFNRGFRIRLQENSGAREFVSAATLAERQATETITEAVSKLVNDYAADPTVSRKSGRLATPQEVIIPATLSKKDAEKFAEVLKSQGIKVTFAQ
jgi:hypothetical protein